jgi:hypothetical protein
MQLSPTKPSSFNNRNMPNHNEECSNITFHGSDSGEEHQNYLKISSDTTFPSRSGKEYALI